MSISFMLLVRMRFRFSTYAANMDTFGLYSNECSSCLLVKRSNITVLLKTIPTFVKSGKTILGGHITAQASRTVGGPLRYRILRMPEKRRALPALNASSDRKEKGMARNMTRNAAASKKITASVPKTHRQTAPQLKDPPQLHTRPTKNTTSIHSHPPPGCPKSPLLKVQSAFWAILAGVELTEGVLFGQAPPGA